jgi:tetratricopeptide (TPR) repeat protein
MMMPSFLSRFPVVRCRRLVVGLFALLLGSPLSAQTFPLSENNWNNPDFVRRFLGSYGALTDREPKITTEEATVLQQVATFLQANNAQGAITLLQGSVTPESSAALEYTIGNLALQSGNFALAERNYREAIRKFPNFLRAYKNLGLAYVQQNKFEESREMFLKALELGDSSGDTFGLVAYTYFNSGDVAKARDAYGLARVLSPGNRDWVVGYAQSLIATREYEKAIAVFEELIKQNSGNAAYYTQIANAYISLQEFDQATRYLEIVRRMGQANAATHVLLGDLYMNASLFDLALQLYLEAYEASGSVSSQRSLRMATAFLSRGAYPQAERFISEIENGRAGDLSAEVQVEFLNLKAELAIVQDKQEEAVATLEQVTTLDPFNGRALILLGNYYARDSRDEAKASYYYDLAQNITGSANEAFIQHARLRVAQREFTKAIELLEKAQAIEYRAPVARYLDAVRRVMDAAR